MKKLKNLLLLFMLIFILGISTSVLAEKTDPVLKFLQSSKETGRLQSLRNQKQENSHFFNDDWVKVAIVFKEVPSEKEFSEFEGKGIKFNYINNSRLGVGRVWGATVSWPLISVLEKSESVESIESVWHPKTESCLDLSVPEIQADRVWQFVDFNNQIIDGTGVRIVDFDTGIDATHPGFFRADGPVYNWIDFNSNGSFDSGIDGVDLNDNGTRESNEALAFWDAYFSDPWGVISNQDGIFQCNQDWLYNDSNSNSQRDYGTSSGYTESDPTYGELMFVVNDTNGNNALDVGETLVALNTSRIYKSLNAGGVERTRGIDLINNQGDSNGHGTGVSGILSSEVRNKRLYVGVAPGAEILMADRVNNDYTVYIPWAETNGADVMLYEYGGYVWHFLDGSEAHEIMVNEEADKGIIQVTPAGNLGNSKKHCAVPLSAGINRVNFDIPSGYNITAAYFTILWTESTWGSSGLTFQLYEPGGISITVNGNGNYQTLDNHDVWSLLSTSSRNTYRMDVYIDGNGGYVDIGNWYIDVNNINGTAGIMHGYLADNMTSWSGGAVWLDSAYISDFPTLCFPATSDKAIVVGSYSTRGIMVPTGSLSLFSSRGDRIDGTFMMDVTAPGNYDLRTVTSKDRAGVFGVYAWFSGTSAAGPHVAAAAALIKQADPGATHLSVENDLQNFCLSDTYTGTIPNNEWGYGKLRLLDLIDSKIYWDSVWPGGGFILNPEWSSGTPSWGTPGEKYIAYIKGTGTGTCDVYVVNTTGTPSPQKITTESDNVNHNSQISWSPDDNFIIFASTTVSNNLNIFKISSDPGNADSSVRVTPSSLENWGRMLDPDWASALNQYNNVERIVMSVSGDIWVYEPNNNVDSDSGLIRITELSDPYQDYSTVDKCLQPKWSEDNTKVVFIRRPATAGETPAPSNVYVINDIQEIISGNRSAINSWSDTYLVQITNNSYPSWSPSFSIDGTKIGYCQDVNSVFNNITFNDSPALALIGTNFDAFDEWGNLIGTPNLNNDFNEGFVKWAPSGGDKFIYVKEDSGEFKIRVIRDETIGGFTKSSTQIIKDKSRSYISIDSDDFYKFSEIKFYSPLFPPSKSPKNFKPTGEYRHILADNREADLENNATLCISFSQAEVRGYNEKNLGMFYWNPQFEKWEEATNVFVNIDGDGIPGNENLDGGFVVAEIRKLGLYGIFAKSKTKQAEITDLSHVRVFPNPYRPAKGEGDEYWGVVFDRLPQNIQEIRIYNLSGELVATTENAIQIFPGWYFNYDYYHYYDNQDPNHKFARWGTTNDNGKPVASGIYIYVIKSETDSKTGKLAIIR